MHDAPGPWTRENRRGRAIIIDADRNEVCEAFAAPALIAAAPDLLAALEDITERYERLLVDSRITKRDAETMREMLPYYTEQARAAIAKATGADHA